MQVKVFTLSTVSVAGATMTQQQHPMQNREHRTQPYDRYDGEIETGLTRIHGRP
jgi:hypothetical protein